MKKQPFLYITGATVFGILLAYSFSFIFPLYYAIPSVILLLVFAVFFFYKKSKISILFLLLAFMVLGFVNYKNHNQLSENHYSNQLKTYDKKIIQLKIVEKLKSSPKNHKYFAEIQYVFDENQHPKPIEGKVLLYVTKTENQLFVNDLIVSKTTYFSIEEDTQYHGYINYLKRKQIFGKLFVKTILTHQESQSIETKIEKWKSEIVKKLEENGYSQSVVSLIQSLLFGQRTEMEKATIQSFQNLGVMHILSISGLHTAIIFALVLWLVNPISYWFGGKKVSITVALLFVVLFTFFVGLKPPVLRTTLMLLLYYGSYFLQRKSSIYHSLYFSAFILLFFNPNFLFDVGFQLSYTAVFFIVWLYPLFQFKEIKNKIINYFSDIASVSFSAQLGTLPLTLYYFNTTSLLFLVGNLLFVPFTFGFILLSFIILFFALLNIQFPFLVWLVNEFVKIVLAIGYWLSDFNFLIFDKIEFSITQVFISYMIILLLPSGFKKYTYQFKTIYFVLLLVLLLCFF